MILKKGREGKACVNKRQAALKADLEKEGWSGGETTAFGYIQGGRAMPGLTQSPIVCSSAAHRKKVKYRVDKPLTQI